ncbi:hypothetical protein MNBD_ALPHA06-1259 [hydrothermal vent metagenome]|uniref:Uncharacterized protein n=1 Tax=hydrothermal vent metagenome TaxID=652676 RepID=A0A3B0S7B3_9ZZZZ
MIHNKTLSNLAPAVTFSVLALGVWMWLLKPELLGLAIIAAGFLPAAWLFTFVINRAKPTAKGNQELRSAITAAGLLLALSLGLSIAEIYQALAPSMSERINSVALGLVLIIMGNYLPKMLQPIKQDKVAAQTGQEMRRFAGWTFVITGFAYALISMFAPIATASTLATYSVILGLAIIAIRFIWIKIER